MTTFRDLGLSKNLLRAIDEKGYSEPSPIQKKAITPILEGRDVMAAAQTGTGKTAAFTLPIIELLQDAERAQSRQCLVLIITPTRELAAQVQESVATYSRYAPVNSAVVYGGVKIGPQISKLKQGVDILVATPGRLLDLHHQGAVNFKSLETLILDEADRMLDMGFIDDIRRIIKLMPQQRQTLLFSATFSAEIRQLAKGFLHKPVEVDVAPRNAMADNVQQWVYPIDKSRKSELMSHLILENGWEQVLIFTRTKRGANRLSQKLEGDGINAVAIHGDKSQAVRTKALSDFKKGKVHALVATDVAARGLDISQLPQVVNFDLPDAAENYVHRIGRTGRAGASGRAYSLVSADEIKQLTDIEQLIRKQLPRQEIDGFEVEHNLPMSAPREARKKPEPGSKKGHKQGPKRGQGQQRKRKGRGSPRR